MPVYRLSNPTFARLGLVVLLGVLTGCAVGPDYQRPDASVG